MFHMECCKVWYWLPRVGVCASICSWLLDRTKCVFQMGSCLSWCQCILLKEKENKKKKIWQVWHSYCNCKIIFFLLVFRLPVINHVSTIFLRHLCWVLWHVAYILCSNKIHLNCYSYVKISFFFQQICLIYQ